MSMENSKSDDTASLPHGSISQDQPQGKRSKPEDTSHAEGKDEDAPDGKKFKRILQSQQQQPSKDDQDAPAYGSQGYWEERYRRQFCSGNRNDNQDDTSETLPYHAWYFTYDDLRPLILPLILGGRNNVQLIMKQAEEEEAQEEEQFEDDEEEEDNKNDELDNQDESARAGTEHETHEVSNKEKDMYNTIRTIINDNQQDEDPIKDEDEEDTADDDSFVEVAEDEEDDDEEDEIEREGLSKDGPISIIEIGCGDVPLGSGLALELLELEETTRKSARKVVKQILCTDYSPSVIEIMQAKYRKFDKQEERPKESAHIGDIPLEFSIIDARKTGFADRTFELILEKGTLDAMLSDKQAGVANCVQIMRECSRILTINGYILVVSHLNAHTERGRGWLRDVVFEGLNGGDPEASWTIEVHGNAEIRDDLPGVPPNSPGPAVYIIKKKGKSVATTNEASTIPVKFFSY